MALGSARKLIVDVLATQQELPETLTGQWMTIRRNVGQND